MTVTIDRETADSLLGYLTGARWFAGKGRLARLVGLTPLPWLTERSAWPAVRCEVAEISYALNQDSADDADRASGATELYQLAISYWPTAQPGLQHAEIGRLTENELGPVVAYDAMQDPAACSLLLARLLEQKSLSSGESEVSFQLVSGTALVGDLEPAIFTGQQSNTSVMFGDVAMLKLFRRLEIGRNLDIEVHESLSRSGVADVAQLFGWVTATWPLRSQRSQLVSADLAMVVEKLAEAKDGWGLASDSLRDQSDFSAEARDLGRALAEIHDALRTAFPSATVPGEKVATIMKDRLASAVDIAPALADHLDGLLSCFEALTVRQLTTQRVHGDFHLGQTLSTPSGWKIIDFEGEPVKSLAERAELDSVWRDLAGMLRSFDYAAASVPEPTSQDWAAACREAFLEGYAGGPLPAAEEAVLWAYVADKAIYEVVYEVRNRPDWVSIPLAAVAALATAPAAAETLKE
ncbi:MAG: phosphotransferase [Propionibacteriaceae bacterium]|nr:phosphotransferase [Propionibacteriaceae bacterium]